MSTRLLYHAFGIGGHDDVRAECRGGRVIFPIARGPPRRW
jgi:hypothetical protein